MRVDPVTALRPVCRKMANHNNKKKKIIDGFQSNTKPSVTAGGVPDTEDEKYHIPNE